MNARVTAAVLAVALLAGCSAAGSGVPLAGLSAANGASNDAVAQKKKRRRAHGYARFVIPHRKIKRGHRGHFVSGATQGASIVATSPTGGTTTTVADLSGASAYCTGGGSARTCTVPVSVPFGDDTITIVTYDQAPNNGVIPHTANELGIGSTTQRVANGVTPSITVFLSGLIASLGVTPAFSSLPADGNQSSAIFVIDPRDFGNKKIGAGTSDPYANPISVKLTESGTTTSHAQLLKNGSATGSSAVLKYSTDTIALQYDGAGKPGYATTVTLKALGAATMTAAVSPLYVTASAVRSHSLGLNGTISNPQLAISEAGAPSTTAYTVTKSGCTAIAVPSSVSGTGPSATFTVAGGSSPSASGCTIAVADSNSPFSPLVLPVTNTPIAGSVTIGGVTLTDYDVGQRSRFITLGPDGNFWFTQIATVGIINPQTQSLVTSFSAPGALAGITTGSDGAVWATDVDNGSVDRFAQGTYAIASYPFSNQSWGGITAASDGTMYFGGYSSGTSSLVNVAPGGLFTVAGGSAPADIPETLTQTPTGLIWFAEAANNVGSYDPSTQTLYEVPVGGTPFDICYGNDGNVWFTVNGSPSYVGSEPESPPYGPPAVYTVAGGASLTGIACGADNAVWYLDAANNQVGRISLASGHAQTTYNIPTSNADPQSIKVGPDGSLWYTEANANNVGQILP